MQSGIRLAALLVAGAAALGPAAPAVASEKPKVLSVTIAGDAVVGATLRAGAEVSGDPEPTIEYRWERCGPDTTDSCEVVAGATSETYVPVANDEGWTLVVRVTASNEAGSDRAKSVPTAPVQAAPAPVPEAAPAPAPKPAPVLAPDTPPAPPTTPIYVLPDAVPSLRYLRPFPVVRIRGSIVSGGAMVTLLRVTAPRRAIVSVRCAGDGCPIRRRTRRAGRIRALERFLPAGVRITIRVRRRGYVGKYVRIRIRDRQATGPARCVRAVPVAAAGRLPAAMTGTERPGWWPAPVIAFLAAALVTVALRDAGGNPARKPMRSLPAATDVAVRVPAPRLADVPDLPAPLVFPRTSRPTAAATSAPATAAPPAPAPTPMPAGEQTAPSQTAPAQTAPPEPPPAPEPPVATPQPTPAPTFDDSGSSPEFDESGPPP